MHGPLSRRTIAWGIILGLIIVNVLIVVILLEKPRELRVSFLDVGQGDAILVESPSGVDLLIDGGRDRSVLRELPKKLGVLDRTIDVVIATHPDADHISGLADVFTRYEVRHFIESGVVNDTSPTERLEAAIETEGIETTIARRGQRIHLGAGAYADILYPDRDVAHVETNTGSIILRLVYGETEFLLTGDAPTSIEDWMVSLYDERLRSDVLKAGHHGSRTSTGERFLAAVRPALVIVSAGEDNSYGHPHQDVLERIASAGARMLSTAEEGTIELRSDGTTIRQK